MPGPPVLIRSAEERQARVFGRRAVYGYRPGRGYPVLLVHGLHGSWRYWRPVMEALPDAFEVFAPDMPGCGRSEPMRSYRAEEQVGWLNAFCEAVDYGAGAVVGHSMGGVIVLGFLRQVPERVGRLILVSAPADEHGVFLPLRMLGWPLVGWWSYWGVRAGFAAWWAWTRLTCRHPELQALLRWALVPSARTIGGTIGGWQGLTTLERGAMFGAPLVPTLVLHGDRDRIVPPAHGERLAAALPGAQFAWLPGRGHIPVVEAPAELAAAIAGFLGHPGDADG